MTQLTTHLNTRIRHSRLFAAAGLLGLSTLTLAGGCASNDAQGGALLGAGIGAIGGAVIGHNNGGRAGEGAAIGAAVGALGGYILGNESDKAKARQYHHPNYHY